MTREFFVFEIDDYRDLFARLFRIQKEKDSEFSLALLAQSCGIQPSYLTNVAKGRAHFSSDQAYLVLTELRRPMEEIEYILLLIDWERSGISSRKKLLKEKLNEIRNQKIRADRVVETSKAKPAASEAIPESFKYYSDPFASILHMYLGTRAARSDSQGISKDLGLDLDRIKILLKNLEEMKLIRKVNGSYVVAVQAQHLASDSPLQRMHHTAIRALSMDKMIRLSKDDYYSFSATVSISDDSRFAIRAEFLKFIQKAQEIVTKAPAEKVMQMHFDFFPWT